MRQWIGQVPLGVVALAAIGSGFVSGLVAANASGAWVRILRTGTGPICSQPPCPSRLIVVGPAMFAEFRPNADVGLAIGVAIATLIVVLWAGARRAPRARPI